MTAQDTAGLVADLRLAERVFNEDPEDHAACLVGTLARRAADALTAKDSELAEARAEIERLNGENKLLDQETRQRLTWHDKAHQYLRERNDLATGKAAAERLLSESQAEGRRLRGALEEIARQKFTRELRSEFGRDYETDWEGGYDACTRRARTTLSSSIGPEKLCLHAPTYDAGLCCGHPDDCTFVSPTARAARDEGDGHG